MSDSVPAMLAPIDNRTAGIGTRFMVKPAWRWHVYVIGPFGDRIVGKTWRFHTAERWVRGKGAVAS